MATLTGKQLKDSYQGLLTIKTADDANPLSGRLENGLGNAITNLGIGTDSPADVLDVRGNSGADKGIIVKNDGSGRAVINLDAGGTSSCEFNFKNQGTLTGGIHSLPSVPLVFYGASSTERMRIDSSGNVGIGTSSVSNITNYKFVSTNGANGGGLVCQKGETDKFAVYSANDDGYYDATSNHVFRTGGALDGTERMRIDSIGNVGIGSSDPDHPLTVTAGPSSAGVPVAWIHNSTNSADHDGTVISSTNDGADAEVLHVRANNTTYSNGTSLMLVRGDGNVGIGGTPASISSTARWLTLNADSGSSASGGIIHQIDGTTKGAQYVFGSNVYHDAKSGIGHQFAVNGGSTAMTIDTSGNVLVGKTVTGLATTGFQAIKSGQSAFSSDGDRSLILNRKTSDGSILEFRKDESTVGSIGVTSGSFAIGQTDTGIGFFNGDRIAFPATSAGAVQDSAIDLGYSSGRWKDLYLGGTAYLQEKITTASSNLKIGVDGSATSSINISSASLYPQTDGSVNLGFSASSFRFATVFATTGTINTSDEKQKQDIEELSEAELRVAQKAKTLMKKYRMISSVEEKGDDARIHVGIIAQDLEKAFADEGLDAGRYGMFIKETTTNDDGEEQTAYAIRYNELLAFIISSI